MQPDQPSHAVVNWLNGLSLERLDIAIDFLESLNILIGDISVSSKCQARNFFSCKAGSVCEKSCKKAESQKPNLKSLRGLKCLSLDSVRLRCHSSPWSSC